MFCNIRTFILTLALLGLAFTHLNAPAQIIDAGDGTAILNAVKEDPAQYLGPQYKDENAGFRMCPPAGSRIINRADLDLMSYVNDAKQWGGSLQMVNLPKEYTLEDYLKATANALAQSKAFAAVQVLENRAITFQKLRAGRLATSMEAEVAASVKGGARDRISMYRQQLMIQLTSKQFLVLTFYTPLKDREAATKTFDAMLTQFEILDRSVIAEQRLKSSEVGRVWLEKRSADELKAKLGAMPQIFRIRVGGKDMGYVRFNAGETTRDKLPGLLLTVDSRAFPNDGSIVMGANEAYWAKVREKDPDDRLWFSNYTNSSKTVLFRPNGKKEEFWLMEIGLLQSIKSTRFTKEEIETLRAQREEIIKRMMVKSAFNNTDKPPPPITESTRILKLSVERTGDETQQLTAGNRSFAANLPDNGTLPLPKILEYTWPRVVELTKPSVMTFLVYNGATGKPQYRTLSVIGPDKINLDGKSVDAIKLSDELDPGTTYIWTDREGKMLMMRTSDQSVLTPTTEEAMRLLWGKQLEKVK